MLKISKIYPDEATGKYDYLGTKGQKIEWEMVPMGELFVEEGTLPGDDPTRPDRRRRHHLAPERPVGRDCGAAVRRRQHSRRGEQFRAGRLPPVQRGFAGSVSGEAGSTTIIGRSPSTRSTRRGTRSVFLRTVDSCA